MPTPATIHCDCGTDLRSEPTDGRVSCPDCESAFAVRIVELPRAHDDSSPFSGTHSTRGP
ncbi:hypothetical protein EA472_05650 [Natrarchaeobius oligotrophus]|uniref:Small CPxCG-related zinc finger protein n=1 Tax=Natrarchaeobius chitinivorans TaxID=1679083 RepID=A0A3N6MD04_NATCH|nr:hypothetical protein EA472_05650 [Natrarchaeobius chitinivorans]